MENYTIIKREHIFSGKGKRLEKIFAKCKKCGNEFAMNRYESIIDDKTTIEYTYCPHCREKLEI